MSHHITALDKTAADAIRCVYPLLIGVQSQQLFTRRTALKNIVENQTTEFSKSKCHKIQVLYLSHHICVCKF